MDPSDAFSDTGRHDSDKIIVFLKEDSSASPRLDIDGRFYDLFTHLEYGQVSGSLPPLTVGELSFNVEGAKVDRVMHGLRLRYEENQRVYKPSPNITVAPVIFLRSRFGAWFRVEDPSRDYELYHDVSQLPQHLHDVEAAAIHLLDEVNRCLGTTLQPVRLLNHYEDEEEFKLIRGVEEKSPNDYVIATGERTHYLLETPTVPNCPYHDWTAANSVGAAMGSGPNFSRSTSPRSFFFSSELQYCAHGAVATAKASRITNANRSRCGSRSGRDGEAFCEIWRFEEHLFCRTCAFQEVCTKATVFSLPCQPASAHSRAS